MTAQSDYNADMARGFDGMLDDSEPVLVRAMRNDDAASVPFGKALAFASTSDHKSAAKLTAITGEIVAGILVHSHAYDNDAQLDGSGVLPGNKLSVLQRGRILVACEDGCQVGDRLHIRALGGTSGALLAAADGINTIDSEPQGVWESAAGAGELAWLRVDFLNQL